ncbi:RNA methyltransferase [Anaplasma centrale str. Israel]|uniref:RNA methyltransferase n=1 Tax=Anaplasma centrale (strain Israel) TaxID=574556 RepID=D1AU26_ANACI|nr:23S rRNA (guanosine(2251)-2'-O)-methyltransferase RlmB [Anaplasma centrale]ACZ49054.1 RNA methyltransferase [Anaplasma centrale str. Israel]
MGRTRNHEECMWICGRHVCISALQNPNRVCRELLVTGEFLKKHPEVARMAQNKGIRPRRVAAEEIGKIWGHGRTVHQGIALRVGKLFGRDGDKLRVEDIVSGSAFTASTVVLLDQVTDINNVGAIVRSAACFDVDAVILPEHHSPSENCIITRVSSGAADLVPVVRVGNLVKTMEYLKQNGYWCYGMDVDGDKALHEISFCERRAIILGSEGKGIRRLTREHCDHLVKIPMSARINSLNVSNAAAIVLYSSYLQLHRSVHDQ